MSIKYKVLFISVLLGIFLLALMSFIKIYDDSYISVSGKIVSIRQYDDFYILNLNNNISVTCENCRFKVNQTIIVTGKKVLKNEKIQIEAEKIKIKK